MPNLFKNYGNSNGGTLGLSQEEIDKINTERKKEVEAEYQQFKIALSDNRCYLCQQEFSHFSKSKPCIHWLVKPRGFKKRHLPVLYEKFSYWRIHPYLRWLANSESLFKNINDLVEEKNSSKIIENTIKYKNLEWSFSASKGDVVGHPTTSYGKIPHYHFQMMIDGRPFINYSDFHLPLSDYDLWILSVERGEIEGIRHIQTRGMGMQGLMDNLEPEKALKGMYIDTARDDEAPFELSTMIVAKPGQSISGDEINELIKESKETGVPMAKLVKKLKSATASTMILPGPGVPKIAGREGGRGSKPGEEKSESLL